MAPRQAHPFVRAGVPLLGLTIGGFAALQFFIQGRIDVQDAQRKELDLRAPVSKQRAKKFNLEEELARLKGEVDINNYENVPVPKPKQLPEDDDA
ncbi:cytochrome c oxidase assembly mitochondrial [Micractinium conductrix]|uniref:Cytochrome c oxidase assembly mitochondrial n=1 Tax=Micractinium conductrix TaxID=554055 RepID=A0A2P6VG95_9CHLO|nr:cytochrome c oxidase assembly mitochondrial [Micractinium conductrix]|eukprot:PSC73105.1 cytochrome c oxidase assembly mitochondrial [Micractinium conductrix]